MRDSWRLGTNRRADVTPIEVCGELSMEFFSKQLLHRDWIMARPPLEREKNRDEATHDYLANPNEG